MNKCAIITLHGMGEVNEEYHLPVEKALDKHFGPSGWRDRITICPVQYQKNLQDQQNKVMDELKRNFPLKWNKTRKFMLYGFSDAGTIAHSHLVEPATYQAILTLVHEQILAANQWLGDEGDKIVVFAQSLGCQVFSNYVWDLCHGNACFAQPNPGLQADPKLLERITHFITTGNNMLLFAAGLSNPKCIQFPNPKTLWSNYYNRNDPLGWPLPELNQTYKGIRNIRVNSGGLFTSWNPVSHIHYWTNGRVVADLMAAIV